MCTLTRGFQWALVRPLGIKTRSDITSGLTTTIATSALSRETSTKETPETAEMHVEKRLKRLWVSIGETLKRLRSTNAGRWWLLWVSGGRKWVPGSSKALMRHVWPYLTPTLIADYLGSHNAPKFLIQGRCLTFVCI